MSKLLILIILLVVGLAGGYYYFAPKSAAPTPSVTVSPQTGLMADVAVWYPSAPWSEPAEDSEVISSYGTFAGESMHATVTSQTASLPHFEIVSELKDKGFLPDNNLSADGPGSSTWGYKKTEDGQNQIILFSYKTQPTSSAPNEPLQFNCPCQVEVNVFVTSPF